MEDPRASRALLFFWSHKDLSDLRWMPSVHSTGMERYWFCTLIQKWNRGPNLMEIFCVWNCWSHFHRFPLLANDVGVYFFVALSDPYLTRALLPNIASFDNSSKSHWIIDTILIVTHKKSIRQLLNTCFVFHSIWCFITPTKKRKKNHSLSFLNIRKLTIHFCMIFIVDFNAILIYRKFFIVFRTLFFLTNCFIRNCYFSSMYESSLRYIPNS